MARLRTYAVHDIEGEKAGTIAVRNAEEIHEALVDLLGPQAIGDRDTARFRITEGEVRLLPREATPARPPPPPPPAPAPDPDPIIPKQALPAALETENGAYAVYYVGARYYNAYSRRTIQVAAVPSTHARNWAPPAPVPPAAIQHIRDQPEQFQLLADDRVAYDRTCDNFYVLGFWRASIARAIQDFARPKAWKELPPAEAKQLVDSLLSLSAHHIRENAARLERVRADIETYQANLVSFIRSEAELRLVAETHKTRTEPTIRKNIEALGAVAGVEAFYVHDNELVIHTEAIAIECPKHPDGSRRKTVYDIGKFAIRLNPADGRLKFRNRTRTINGRHHPHIDSGGNACLGEIQTAVPELVGKVELASLARVLLIYLRSVNLEDSAGARITLWPVVSAEDPSPENAALPEEEDEDYDEDYEPLDE